MRKTRLEDAQEYPQALAIVRDRVKSQREAAAAERPIKRYQDLATKWWLFERPNPGLTAAVASLPRFALAGITGKRWLTVWGEPGWRPSITIVAFATADDMDFGVIASKVHEVWARATGSTFKGDMRYTPTSCFATFPWPEINADHHATIGASTRAVVGLRESACRSRGIGPRALYNAMDHGAFSELREAHDELDRAVIAAYGLPTALLDDEPALLDALFDLNEEASKNPSYGPFQTKSGGSPAPLG